MEKYNIDKKVSVLNIKSSSKQEIKIRIPEKWGKVFNGISITEFGSIKPTHISIEADSGTRIKNGNKN